jgi:hypothetical protein
MPYQRRPLEPQVCRHCGKEFVRRAPFLYCSEPCRRANVPPPFSRPRVRGEKHHRAKLSEDQVRDLRARYAAGQVSLSKLAAEFDVSTSTVAKVIYRKTWSHVD